MAKLLVLCVLFAVLLGSSVSEGRSYKSYSSYKRGGGQSRKKSGLSELKETVSALQQNVSQLLNPTVTGFTAFFAINDSDIAAGENLIFPNALDYGDDYDEENGVFTAPVDGIYNVGVSIRPSSVEGEAASVLLMKENANGFSFPLGLVTVSADTVPNASSSTNTVIYLDAGCQVMVINQANATFSAGTSFTAFLITPVTIEDPLGEFAIA